MPLFSIVTVTLNPPTGDLRRTLDSVLGQDFEDWELIIKDGGSEFGWVEGIPEDGRIRVLVQKDSGIFDAMNQTLGLVEGRYVCFLNAGDTFYDIHALRAVKAAIGDNPGVDFFYGDVAKPSSRSGFEIYPRRLTRRFLFSHSICHQAWFVSAGYYDRPERYDTKHAVGGDPAFLLRMLLQHKVRSRKVERVIVSYAGGGISQDAKHVRDNQLRIRKLKKELYGKGEYGWLRSRELAHHVAKRLLYDTGAWRFVKTIKSINIARQQTLKCKAK
ncbi:MAG: glycosyltransferase [Verrucomicrobiota bacterium]